MMEPKWNMIGLESLDYTNLTYGNEADPEQNALKEICITNGINLKKLPIEGPKVKSLELFFNGFLELHCMKKFPNITKLVLFGSDLSALFRVDFGSLLTELWLCEANLKRIPDLTECPGIEMLYLYGNKLTKIDNLKHLKNLQILDLAENRLEDMVGLSTLSDLNELNLAANRIRKIGPELEKLKKLSKLDLSGNPIESLIELNPLRNLFNLTQLNIAQNIYPLAPICKLQNYQLQIFYTLQSLTSLDGEEVSKRIVTEAIKVIKRKIIYYNMKNTVLRRSLPEYINTVRNLSESRLNVPMESIKDLKAESFRVLKMKNKDQLGQIEKAAINHKIDLLEGRLNYWKEFHRKLQREQRKAFQALNNSYRLSELMIELELQSGGNIRFEEAEKDEKDDEKEQAEPIADTMQDELETINYWGEISKLVEKNCARNRRTVLGIEEIEINRITRIFHRPKRMKFDEEMDDILYQTNYNINQSYVFLQSDPTKPEETVRFIDKGSRLSPSTNILCTSPFDADLRFNKNYNSSYPPASCHLIVCRVYLGRSLPVKCDQWDIKSYQNADSIYEETLNGRKYSLLSQHHLLPEYIIEMEYIPKPRSFPPLIFHHLIDNHRHQFTPRPTQAQEDKDYEVKNCHPRTSPAGISNILNNEISNLTILELVGQNLQAIPNLITFPHLKELNVSCNRLTSVERVIRCSRQLQIFNCGHNCITSFDLPEFKQLNSIDLSWNHLNRLSQMILMFNSKTPSLSNLDLKSNFFTEDNVFEHCVAKIPSLKIMNGTTINEADKQNLIQQMSLNKSIIKSRGRTGNAHGSIKLMNTSQYLMSFDKINDMSKITSLCLDGMGLNSISELKQIITLRYLSINSNHIHDLSPLKSCIKLVELCASDNKLVKVTQVINSLPAVQFLDLSQNDILELPLDKGLIYLTTLNLSGNRISQVSSYTKLKRLKELYLSNNLIGDCNELIHLKNCQCLEILDITKNPFKEKLDNAPKLFIMYHFNNLKALDGYPVDTKDVRRAKDIFGGRLTNDFLVEKFGYSDGVAHVNLNAIDELDLRDCDIRSVHLEPDKLINLTSLNMMGNLLTNFSGLIYLKEVKTLCLSNNNIESVFPLTKHQRAQMNRSQYSQYQNRHTGGDNKRLSAKASEDSELLPKLEVLHLGNNKIKDMCLLQLRRFPVLKSLFLEGNDITKIDGLDGCSNIRHLVLDRNRIKQIDPNSFHGQWRLEELHLDSNRLMYMSNIRPLVNLKRLYLGMNRIQEVDEIAKLRPLTSLMDVSVIGNGLARRMLHRPMLIWHVPSIENIDGMKVSIEERQNAEAYFMDQGQEPVFHMFDSFNGNYPRNEHQNGTTTPSLSAVLSHGYKSYHSAPLKGSGNRSATGNGNNKQRK